MLKDIPPDQLSEVIGQATAPAFLLGAVAGLMSLLVNRLDGIAERVGRLRAEETGRSISSPEARAGARQAGEMGLLPVRP